MMLVRSSSMLDEEDFLSLNCWTEIYSNRATYTSQAKAKAEDYIWEKKITAGWDVTAVNENA